VVGGGVVVPLALIGPRAAGPGDQGAQRRAVNTARPRAPVVGSISHGGVQLGQRQGQDDEVGVAEHQPTQARP
jgi:hypothetical protein